MSDKANAPVNAPLSASSLSRGGILQRQCQSCGQHKPTSEECPACKKKPLQRKAVNSESDGEVPPIVEEVLRSPGQPLDAEARTFMESRFGHDFSRVRVHTDEKAVRSTRAVGAVAYTVGRNIAFGAGQYKPRTNFGKQLLAHELTHVVQQKSVQGVQGRTELGTVGGQFEQEAEQVSQQILTANPLRQITSISQTLPVVQKNGDLVCRDPSVEAQACLPPDSEGGEQGHSTEEIAEAGLIAVGQVLQDVAAPEAQTLRDLYNKGAAAIEAERARMLASGVPEEELARRLSQMRHELAVNVRRTGSALMRQGAELFDLIRGNRGRPTYESLRASGKTNAQIIKSANQTNGFINRLPTGLRWTGRGLWFLSAGISVYVVLDAPPERRAEVAQREVEGIVGGITGAMVFEGVCIITGVATEGLGLLVCGLIGGVVGFEAARRTSLLQILDIAPHEVSGLAGRIYQIQGDWDVSDFFLFEIVHRTVAASENILVTATGRRSGELVSGRGHYRSLEVIPANDAAARLFGSREARFVPEYLLQPASGADLARSRD